MVSSLAGSLALVTCKEPLRVSLSNQLRVLLQQVPQNGLDQAALEQTVQTIVNDNLEVRASQAVFTAGSTWSDWPTTCCLTQRGLQSASCHRLGVSSALQVYRHQ